MSVMKSAAALVLGFVVSIALVAPWTAHAQRRWRVGVILAPMQVEGTLDKGMVRRALTSSFGGLAACIEEHPSTEGGRLEGSFRIDPEGVMRRLSVEASELPAGLLGCAERALEQTRFPRSDGTSHVSGLLIIIERVAE